MNKVAAVVVTYNRKELLSTCLESISLDYVSVNIASFSEPISTVAETNSINHNKQNAMNVKLVKRGGVQYILGLW
jgi:GT2 family glycosyltransferase